MVVVKIREIDSKNYRFPHSFVVFLRSYINIQKWYKPTKHITSITLNKTRLIDGKAVELCLIKAYLKYLVLVFSENLYVDWLLSAQLLETTKIIEQLRKCAIWGDVMRTDSVCLNELSAFFRIFLFDKWMSS